MIPDHLTSYIKPQPTLKNLYLLIIHNMCAENSCADVGGQTEFYSQTEPREKISVKTPLGAALYFPHGAHPQHCLHSYEIISTGVKYIIRTDVLFSSS